MYRKQKFRQTKYRLLFLPLFALYLYCSPSTVYWQDSGIYLAGLKTQGIIYPPGYPLYLMTANLWTFCLSKLTSGKFTFARYVHSFSALMGTIACYFVFLSVAHLVSFMEQVLFKSNKKYIHLSDRYRIVIPLASAFTCGFSYSLWSQSINSEVYSMMGMFSSITFYLVIRLLIIKYKNQRKVAAESCFNVLLGLTIITALSFANHPLSWVISIPVLWFTAWTVGFKQIKKIGLINILLLMLTFVGIVCICYSLLFIRTRMEPYYLWNKVDSLRNLWYQISGREYYQGKSPLGFSAGRLVSFFVLFFQEMFVVASALFAIGIKTLNNFNRVTKNLTIFIVVFSLTIYLACILYKTGGTEYNYWLIPVYILFYIVCGIGLWSLFLKIKINLGRILLIIFFISTPLVVNFFYNNRRDYVLAQEFGKNILKHLPPNSILFIVGDQDSSITKYLEVVEGYRPDIALMRPAEFSDVWRIAHIQRFYPFVKIPDAYRNTPDYVSDPDRFLSEFIKENIGFSEIFLIQRSLIEPDGLYTVPYGTLWRLSAREDETIDLSAWEYEFTDPKRYLHPERKEGARKVYDDYGNEGVLREKYSDEPKSFELQAKKNLGDICLEKDRRGSYLKVKLKDGNFDQWRGTRLLVCAKNAYEEMFAIDTGFYNEAVYLNLAEVYEKLNEVEKSKKYYNEVLLRKNKGVI